MYCISQVPDVFMGMSCSNSRSEKFNDVIKEHIPNESYPAGVIILLDDVIRRKVNIKKIAPIELIDFERRLMDDGLANVRRALGASIFRSFLKCYGNAIKSSITIEINP